MRLLVTGGAGFIGSNFITYILNNYPDDSVVCLDLLTYAGNLENLKELENDSRLEFIKGDIGDYALVEKLMSSCDAVVNFAAETHVDRSIMNGEDFLRTNVLGTRVLLETAVKCGKKRFHHVSTDEVFGSLGPDAAPFNEQTPYDPRSPYSASKAASDHLVRAYFHTYNLPITISNCSNNYGPNQFPEKLHALFITNLMEGKTVPIYGDGLQKRDWLYVSDHCRALDMILRRGKIGETYCVGGGENRTNLEITQKIIELLDASADKIEYVQDRPGHDRRYAIDYSKIKNELGWMPSVDFEQGMKLTVDWYKNNIDWWKKIKNGDYQNYYNQQYGNK